jgi:hypothetical protein
MEVPKKCWWYREIDDGETVTLLLWLIVNVVTPVVFALMAVCVATVIWSLAGAICKLI